MASIIVNRGLQVIGGRASNTADSFSAIQTMAVDDGADAFAAGHDSLDDGAGGAPTNEADTAFDSTPSRTNQTVSHVATFGTGAANFTVKRISLHNDTAANVSKTSATLVGGVDGQSIGKTSDFSMTITIDIAYADNS